MKKTQLIVAVAVATVLGVGALAEAQGPRGRGFGPRGGFLGLPAAGLNLTDAQRDLIRDIRERERTELQPVQARLREARAAQQKVLNAFPVDENAIRAATLAVAEVEAELAAHQARVRNEVFAVLTPEQQETVKKTIAEREQRMQQRMKERQSRANERRGNAR